MSPPAEMERRRNKTLRELLDDLIDHVRDVARRGRTMDAGEIAYAQERLEWLADEVWRSALAGEDTTEPEE